MFLYQMENLGRKPVGTQEFPCTAGNGTKQTITIRTILDGWNPEIGNRATLTSSKLQK